LFNTIYDLIERINNDRQNNYWWGWCEWVRVFW
jgi:hypothetical protein